MPLSTKLLTNLTTTSTNNQPSSLADNSSKIEVYFYRERYFLKLKDKRTDPEVATPFGANVIKLSIDLLRLMVTFPPVPHRALGLKIPIPHFWLKFESIVILPRILKPKVIGTKNAMMNDMKSLNNLYFSIKVVAK